MEVLQKCIDESAAVRNFDKVDGKIKNIKKHLQGFEKCISQESEFTDLKPEFLEGFTELLINIITLQTNNQTLEIKEDPERNIAYIIIKIVNIIYNLLSYNSNELGEFEEEFQKLFTITPTNVELKNINIPIVYFKDPPLPVTLSKVSNSFFGSSISNLSITKPLKKVWIQHAMSTKKFIDIMQRRSDCELILQAAKPFDQYLTTTGLLYTAVVIDDENLPSATKENRYGGIVLKCPLQDIFQRKPEYKNMFVLGTKQYCEEYAQTILVDPDSENWWVFHGKNSEKIKSKESGFRKLEKIDLESYNWELKYDTNTGEWTHPELAFFGSVEIPINACKIQFVQHECLGCKRELCGDCELSGDEVREKFIQGIYNLAKESILKFQEFMKKYGQVFADKDFEYFKGWVEAKGFQ